MQFQELKNRDQLKLILVASLQEHAMNYLHEIREFNTTLSRNDLTCLEYLKMFAKWYVDDQYSCYHLTTSYKPPRDLEHVINIVRPKAFNNHKMFITRCFIPMLLGSKHINNKKSIQPRIISFIESHADGRQHYHSLVAVHKDTEHRLLTYVNYVDHDTEELMKYKKISKKFNRHMYSVINAQIKPITDFTTQVCYVPKLYGYQHNEEYRAEFPDSLERHHEKSFKVVNGKKVFISRIDDYQQHLINVIRQKVNYHSSSLDNFYA